METHSTQDAVIAINESLSGALALGNGVPLAIVMPGTWTAANLTFQGSADGATYNHMYDDAGTEYTVTAAASRFIVLDPTKFAGIAHLKIRSGTSGTPVSQAAERTLVVVVAPLWVR